MKRIIFVQLFLAIFLLVWNPLYGQVDSTKSATRIGIGVSIGNDLALGNGEFVFLPLGLGNFYIPILVSPKLRLEPEFGLFRSSSSNDNFETTLTNFRFGLGIFPLIQKDKANLYYGLRVGIILTSSSFKFDDIDDSESKTDFYIGPAVGGEYFFNDHISLGGEVQLNYISIGQEDDDSDVSESVIVTRTLVFIRWYF